MLYLHQFLLKLSGLVRWKEHITVTVTLFLTELLPLMFGQERRINPFEDPLSYYSWAPCHGFQGCSQGTRSLQLWIQEGSGV